MTYDPTFDEFMPLTVSWYPFNARDNYGEASYAATATAVKCRVEPSTKVIRTPTGEEKITSATLYISGVKGISPKDRLVLPDGTTPPILRVDKHYDEDGEHHEVVFLA